MRLGQIIGRVTLSVAIPELTGARWLIVSPYGRQQYASEGSGSSGLSGEPSLIVYDDLGGAVGQTTGFVEGREAACPFHKPTPIDAINTALVDEIFYNPLNP
jgi:hypothetical protein